MRGLPRQPLARLWSSSARDNTVNQVARPPAPLQVLVQVQVLAQTQAQVQVQVRAVVEVWEEAVDVVAAVVVEASVVAVARARAGGIDSEC